MAPVNTDRPTLRSFVEEQARKAGANIRARRKLLGLTQEQLAAAADSTAQTINKIETGEIVAREDLRLALAIALGAEPEELFPVPERADVLDWIRRAEKLADTVTAARQRETPEAVA